MSDFNSKSRIPVKLLSNIIALQSITVAPRVVASVAQDVTNYNAIYLYMRMGRINATNFTAALNLRIDASGKSSGNTDWYPVTIFSSALGSSIASTTVSTQSASGQAVVTVTTTTGFAVGDIVYIQNATEANSEWGRIVSIAAGTPGTITLQDNLTNTQQVGAKVTNQSEIYSPVQIDCTGISRIRAILDGSGTAVNFDGSADMVAYT